MENEVKRKSAIVIPARYASTRFPGKVLACLQDKPIIQWVHERAVAAHADEVFVATDDQRVAEVVTAFGGSSIMTRPEHPSGTDRIWEAIQEIDGEIIVNVQGDEPLIPSEMIDQLIAIMQENPDVEMATVAVAGKREDIENNPNIVKVDRKSTRLNSSHIPLSRMPSSA